MTFNLFLASRLVYRWVFLKFAFLTKWQVWSVGRQNTAWKLFGYIPTDYDDPLSTGLETREASRSLEVNKFSMTAHWKFWLISKIVQYALGDFAVRQAGLALNKSSDIVQKYANRSMNFVNVWDPNVTSDGFMGFSQKRLPVSSRLTRAIIHSSFS